MAPALGLAVAAPAATAAAAAVPAAAASGKKVSLQAGQATSATACTGTQTKTVTAGFSHLGISVSYKGNCVIGVIGHLGYSGSPGSADGDMMRTRIYSGGAQVYSGRASFSDSSGSVRAGLGPHVIGRTVCAAAFSNVHPRKRIGGPVCVRI